MQPCDAGARETLETAASIHKSERNAELLRVRLTLRSSNQKTGPIPVSTTASRSCPPSCAMRSACYAKRGPLAQRWREVDDRTHGMPWSSFVDEVAALPAGTLWRHNQAGDLPGIGETIDAGALQELTLANVGKRGFTYTHKPVLHPDVPIGTLVRNNAAIAEANAGGFTVNLSTESLEGADEALALGIGPVVTVLPSSVKGNVKIKTPEGAQVVVCPATYRKEVTCKTCGLCAVRDRKVVVGFPQH